MRMVVLLLSLCILSNVQASTLNQVRKYFTQALNDKNICRQMMGELQAKANDPLYLGYLGGFQAIWATHVVNPFSKLKTFKQGKLNIENAIGKDADNVELRYIRFSIQENAPSFLGYNQQMRGDRDFLLLHKKDITSSLVINYVEKLLKE